MRKYKIALIIESVVLVLMVFAIVFAVGIEFLFNKSGSEVEEKYKENSPDGRYVLVVNEIGEPIWPFGPMQYEVRLTSLNNKSNEGSAAFKTWVFDDGGRGSFSVKWEKGQAVITFDGEEQSEAVFALPLK